MVKYIYLVNPGTALPSRKLGLNAFEGLSEDASLMPA
jgi:hypothetical protein